RTPCRPPGPREPTSVLRGLSPPPCLRERVAGGPRGGPREFEGGGRVPVPPVGAPRRSSPRWTGEDRAGQGPGSWGTASASPPDAAGGGGEGHAGARRGAARNPGCAAT